MSFGFRALRVSAALSCIVAMTTALTACSDKNDGESAAAVRKPQQAGQPVDPARAAAHLVGARVAAATGDTKAAEAHVLALADDMRRSARMPNVMRPIHRESARVAVRPLPGVKSVIWMDHENLIVMVDGQRHRTMAKIDEVCLALEPLGDTLAIVVNLQDATARNGDEAMTLSRNCQLADGQRAAFQRKRQIDVVDRETRDAFKQMQRKQATDAP